ncbi:hypothetical protein [Kitasatospora sp. MAP5-34]|uniref:hypothetical protein n=1 Tax=Kitasatospora sp. MAP5-34 TaxID=3035102 RepID=UPI002476A2BF|nr:hypothetical protein [Kitasatospora sp. MAP5-34]MDH6578713.1 hypothetical protein [Kitasatospora sp. MAP5-34]
MTEIDITPTVLSHLEGIRARIADELAVREPELKTRAESRSTAGSLLSAYISIVRIDDTEDPVDISLEFIRSGDDFVATMDACRESGEVLLSPPDIPIGAMALPSALREVLSGFDEMTQDVTDIAVSQLCS